MKRFDEYTEENDFESKEVVEKSEIKEEEPVYKKKYASKKQDKSPNYGIIVKVKKEFIVIEIDYGNKKVLKPIPYRKDVGIGDKIEI